MPPPQLTPQQQFLVDLKQNQPETYRALDFKKQTEAYARAEFQKRDQQAILDKLNTNATPGSPFQQQMWEQAKQQVMKDHAAMNTGVPLTANAIADQAGKAFQRTYEPWGAETRATIQSSQNLVEGFVKEQIKMAEDTRPQIADHPDLVEQLQGYKEGINKIDLATSQYLAAVKQDPHLGGALTGQWAARAAGLLNDPQIKPYLQTMPLLQSYYAKNVGSESGRLSNQGMDLAASAVPSPGDSPQVAISKANELKQYIASAYQSKLAGLQTAGMKTGDFRKIDVNDPTTYAPMPRDDAGNNPAGTFSPGMNPTADPTQNPTVGQPQSQATPAALPDYAQRMNSNIDNFLTGNSKQAVAQQQQAAQQAQQQQAAAQQAQAQQAQQAAAQAQQAGAQQQQAGAMAAQKVGYSD
jgi:hypothetical protein